MIYPIKNKILIWAVALLLIANMVTLGTFWFARSKPLRSRTVQPAEYLIKELAFDTMQKTAYMQLVHDHQQKAEKIRREIKSGRDHFFNLLQQTNVTDSDKKAAAIVIYRLTEKLDLLTFDHFQKVRNICNNDQKKKFDVVIHDVLNVVGESGQRGMHGPGAPPVRAQDGPPPGREHDPPPERGNEQPPPPQP